MVTQAQTRTDDPYDSAMNSEWNPSLTIFGQCSVDVWYCVLQKGQGKVPFDPGQHSIDQRCTAIDIAIQPLPGSKAQFATERGLIAESREWAQIVKPSLRALNIDLRAINGHYVRAELVPTGQTYTNSQGETKQRTTIKFVAIYNSLDECQAAADAFFAARGSASSSSTESAVPPSESAGTQTPVGASSNGNGTNDTEKTTAAKFLPALWNASGKDITKFAEMLAKNPLVSKYFDLNSPEVLSLTAPS